MGIFINILVLAIAVGAFAVSGGYATHGAVQITDIPAYKQNPDLSAAHGRLSWAAIVTWITIALMILGVVLYIIFAFETAEYTGSWVINILILISLAGSIAVGILAAMAAYDINKSNVTDNKGSYKSAVIAAVLGIVVSVLIIGLFILNMVYKSKKKTKAKDASLVDELLGQPEMPDFLTKEIGSDPELAAEMV